MKLSLNIIIAATLSIILLSSCSTSENKVKLKRVIDGRLRVEYVDNMYHIGDTLIFRDMTTDFQYTIIEEETPRPTRHSYTWSHHCEWSTGDSAGNIIPCRYEGLTRDQFFSNADEGSDAYYFDLNHFTHPDWSETHCDDAIFEVRR